MLLRKVRVAEAGARFRIGDTVIAIERISPSRVHLFCDGPDLIEWLSDDPSLSLAPAVKVPD